MEIVVGLQEGVAAVKKELEPKMVVLIGSLR